MKMSRAWRVIATVAVTVIMLAGLPHCMDPRKMGSTGITDAKGGRVVELEQELAVCRESKFVYQDVDCEASVKDAALWKKLAKQCRGVAEHCKWIVDQCVVIFNEERRCVP